MNSELLTSLLAVALAIAFALVCVDVARRERFLRRSIERTSRFPLFAVRDRLVALVIDGRIDERDPAWQDTYGGFNDLLGQSYRRSAIGLFHDHVRFSARVATDPVFRGRFLEHRARLDALASRVPEFQDVLTAGDLAVRSMCDRRTSPLRVRVYLLSVKSVVALVALFAHGGRAAIGLWRIDRGGEGTMGASQLMAFRHHERAALTT